MHQISVTIGRRDNVNGLELSDHEWAAFKSCTVDLVAQGIGCTVVVQNEGLGEWEGVSEGNFVVIGIRDEAFTDRDKRDVRHLLSVFARLNDQDSIALSFGTSELVEAEAVDEHSPADVRARLAAEAVELDPPEPAACNGEGSKHTTANYRG